MKKMMILATLVLVYATTFAQKKEKVEKDIPTYYGKIRLMTNWEKKDSLNPGKNAELSANGVYGGFAYDLTITQPFDNKRNWGLRQMKTVTLGYGINKKISYGQRVLDDKSYHLAAGIGPTLMLTPKPDSVKKKNNNDMFLGATIFADIIGEQSGVEADAKLMYVFLPANNDTVWSENVFSPEIQVKKFFGGIFGISAGWRMLFYSTSERQVQGRPYHGTAITQTRSEISLGLCAKFRSITFMSGVIIPRERYKIADNSGARATNFFEAKTGKTVLSIGLQIDFANPPK